MGMKTKSRPSVVLTSLRDLAGLMDTDTTTRVRQANKAEQDTAKPEPTATDTAHWLAAMSNRFGDTDVRFRCPECGGLLGDNGCVTVGCGGAQ